MSDLSDLPRVDGVLDHPDVAARAAAVGRDVVVGVVREVIDAAREDALAGTSVPVPTLDEVASTVLARLDARDRGGMRPVVNATGVLLHTNLGRAPLSAAAREAVLAATGWTTVELDRDTGRRGSRTAHVGRLAAELCGTEAGFVVNNGAAALVLVLAALAPDAATVVSRGELIEIGGSYRLPDVITAAGTRLVEVGTTNRTHAADYDEAMTAADGVGVVLKVHPSNYAVSGFTASVSIPELAELAHGHGWPLVADLGSGLLTDHDGVFADEPSVAAAVAGDADLVLFSGDKLLGGPQAGFVVGRADLVERCRRHPLARAMRIDKLQRAALEAMLAAHLRDPGGLTTSQPLGAMLARTVAELRARAGSITEAVGDDRVVVLALDSVVGGGTLPGQQLASAGLSVPDPSGDVTAALREAGVVARVEDGRCLLDLRTVDPSEDEAITVALAAVLRPDSA